MKSLFIVAGLLLIVGYTHAQWNPNGATTGNIYYSGGNVGIGTSTPTYKLDVTGNLRTTSSITASEYITVGSGGSYRVGMNAQTDGYITGRNAAFQDRFLINSNGDSYFNGGNVGIGISSPLTLLNINRGTGDPIIGSAALRIGGTNNYPSLEFGIKGGYDGMISTYGNDLHIYAGNWRSPGVNATENHNISFYTSQSGSGNWNTPKLFLRYNGNLGVGTTTPEYAVDIQTSSDNFAQLRIKSPGFIFNACNARIIAEVPEDVAMQYFELK